MVIGCVLRTAGSSIILNYADPLTSLELLTCIYIYIYYILIILFRRFATSLGPAPAAGSLEHPGAPAARSTQQPGDQLASAVGTPAHYQPRLRSQDQQAKAKQHEKVIQSSYRMSKKSCPVVAR